MDGRAPLPLLLQLVTNARTPAMTFIVPLRKHVSGGHQATLLAGHRGSSPLSRHRALAPVAARACAAAGSFQPGRKMTGLAESARHMQQCYTSATYKWYKIAGAFSPAGQISPMALTNQPRECAGFRRFQSVPKLQRSTLTVVAGTEGLTIKTIAPILDTGKLHHH